MSGQALRLLGAPDRRRWIVGEDALSAGKAKETPQRREASGLTSLTDPVASLGSQEGADGQGFDLVRPYQLEILAEKVLREEMQESLEITPIGSQSVWRHDSLFS
jgi:hypothetical protein